MPSSTKTKQREYDSKRAGARTRNWTAVLYPDDLPDDWREKMDSVHVKWIESPLHNGDFNADGTPKKIHIHTLLMFDNVKNVGQVKQFFIDLFGESESGTIPGVATPQRVSDKCALVRYMAHLDHPSKCQYDPADIIGHNGADPADIMRYSATETREMMVELEQYIDDNNITELCDLSAMIRYDHPEWYTLLATKCTVYFNAYIRSRRHKYQRIDLETGEIQ